MGDYVVRSESKPRFSLVEFAFLVVVAWAVNVAALAVVDWLFDDVSIGGWGSLLLGAAVLGLAHAFLKPILVLLTLPLIVVTLGLGYLAISIGMLALAEWIAPEFSIDGFWTYVGAVFVIWLVNWILGALAGGILRRTLV
jgi:putative membrane protein